MAPHGIPTALAAQATARAADNAPSFAGIAIDLPTDPASIFTLLLVLASVALVVWFGRPRGGKGGRPT